MTMDALNRCVVGIRPPLAWQEGIAAAQREFRRRAGDDVRAIPASEWLLAVVTLGELRLDQMAQAQRVITDLAAQAPNPLSLTSEGTRGLPNATMPKSVALAIGGDVGVLRILHDAAKVPLGLPSHAEFEPAIEFARSRTGNDRTRADLGRAIKMVPAPALPPWPVSHLEFLRATAGPTGPAYECLAQIPLGS